MAISCKQQRERESERKNQYVHSSAQHSRRVEYRPSLLPFLGRGDHGRIQPFPSGGSRIQVARGSQKSVFHRGRGDRGGHSLSHQGGPGFRLHGGCSKSLFQQGRGKMCGYSLSHWGMRGGSRKLLLHLGRGERGRYSLSHRKSWVQVARGSQKSVFHMGRGNRGGYSLSHRGIPDSGCKEDPKSWYFTWGGGTWVDTAFPIGRIYSFP